MNDDFPDLFGPVEAPRRRKRGRPPHVPTRETRAKADRLLIAGCPVPAIARALKISPPTFRLYYLHTKSEKK